MARVAFTDLTIRNLKPGSYFDEKTPAFGIRVGKNRKTWIVIRGRERIRTRVGHYPALALAEARKKALVLLGTPLEQIPVSTFSDARELFLCTHCAQKQRERTRKETERLLTKHFVSLDRKKLPAITTAQVSVILDGLLETPLEAQHAYKVARTFPVGGGEGLLQEPVHDAGTVQGRFPGTGFDRCRAPKGVPAGDRSVRPDRPAADTDRATPFRNQHSEMGLHRLRRTRYPCRQKV
ncbi:MULTISPECIES: Arm DNA-binding domain-containing protein [Bradyrhizobium]|uniref:Integrase DNA-binding domain-containing protein n=1 Tax=Bradyrhizobium japonicum TaxID=375 RepID=A0ABV2S6P3_BRAJP|nr:Arm DNA-binding domain-containing protein [Bradyrhizobium sp. CCBAU 15544]